MFSNIQPAKTTYNQSSAHNPGSSKAPSIPTMRQAAAIAGNYFPSALNSGIQSTAALLPKAREFSPIPPNSTGNSLLAVYNHAISAKSEVTDPFKDRIEHLTKLPNKITQDESLRLCNVIEKKTFEEAFVIIESECKKKQARPLPKMIADLMNTKGGWERKKVIFPPYNSNADIIANFFLQAGEENDLTALLDAYDHAAKLSLGSYRIYEAFIRALRRYPEKFEEAKKAFKKSQEVGCTDPTVYKQYIAFTCENPGHFQNFTTVFEDIEKLSNLDVRSAITLFNYALSENEFEASQKAFALVIQIYDAAKDRRELKIIKRVLKWAQSVAKVNTFSSRNFITPIVAFLEKEKNTLSQLAEQPGSTLTKTSDTCHQTTTSSQAMLDDTDPLLDRIINLFNFKKKMDQASTNKLVDAIKKKSFEEAFEIVASECEKTQTLPLTQTINTLLLTNGGWKYKKVIFSLCDNDPQLIGTFLIEAQKANDFDQIRFVYEKAVKNSMKHGIIYKKFILVLRNHPEKFEEAKKALNTAKEFGCAIAGVYKQFIAFTCLSRGHFQDLEVVFKEARELGFLDDASYILFINYAASESQFERAARRNPGPSSLSQASYLSSRGNELAAHYRSGESPSFQEGVLQTAHAAYLSARKLGFDKSKLENAALNLLPHYVASKNSSREAFENSQMITKEEDVDPLKDTILEMNKLPYVMQEKTGESLTTLIKDKSFNEALDTVATACKILQTRPHARLLKALFETEGDWEHKKVLMFYGLVIVRSVKTNMNLANFDEAEELEKNDHAFSSNIYHNFIRVACASPGHFQDLKTLFEEEANWPFLNDDSYIALIQYAANENQLKASYDIFLKADPNKCNHRVYAAMIEAASSLENFAIAHKTYMKAIDMGINHRLIEQKYSIAADKCIQNDDIQAAMTSGTPDEAYGLLVSAKLENRVNRKTFIDFLNFARSKQRFDLAQKAFRDAQEMRLADIHICNAYILAASNPMQLEIVSKIFDELEAKQIANGTTYVNMIEASGNSGLFEKAKKLYEQGKKSFPLREAFIQAAGKTGKFSEAKEAFIEVKEKAKIDIHKSFIKTAIITNNLDEAEIAFKEWDKAKGSLNGFYINELVRNNKFEKAWESSLSFAIFSPPGTEPTTLQNHYLTQHAPDQWNLLVGSDVPKYQEFAEFIKADLEKNYPEWEAVQAVVEGKINLSLTRKH